MKTKKCNVCKTNLSLDKFYNNKNSKDNLDNKCKTCSKAYREKYKERNSKKIKAWHKENKEDLQKYYKQRYQKNKEYYKKVAKKNKEKIKVQAKGRYKKKYKNNLQYTLGLSLRNRIKNAIKNNFKYGSTLELLGGPIDKIKKHLQSQFKPEMNWENYGDIWEIDHILPCSSFDLTDEEQQKICFHYSNLQPLFKTTEIAESFGYVNEIGNRNKHAKLI